jgi:molybdopterin-guanine dinucleotide biosynthesis protein A
MGPLSGIATSLAACRGTHLLVLAVDMPTLTREIISRLLARCGANFGAIPHIDGESQPLAAVYTRECLDPASRALAQGALSVRGWAAECLRLAFCLRWDVPPRDGPLFANWNSPSDVPRGGVHENLDF